MRKLISFMHVSLDGFVAGPNGEMDWIRIDDEIFSIVENRVNKGDTALYGRVTYELMEGYWPTAADQPNATRHDIEHAKWYMKAHKIVLSKTLKSAGGTNTEIVSDNLVERINEIKNRKGSEILIFGSPSATHALIQHNLVDGFWMFVNPIVIGKGLPLFSGIKDQVKLKLLLSQQLKNGVIELNYEVDK